MLRLPLLCTLLLLAGASPAGAMVKLPEHPAPIAGNPADRLLSLPIEDSAYDGARKCTPKASRPGMLALQRWLEANVRGVFWGSYRCEKWGKGKLKRMLNKTIAHRDHVHIGMTKRGAAARTSFWSRGR
jgi:hypothetical protein